VALLVLVGAVPDLVQAVEEDGAGQGVAGLTPALRGLPSFSTRFSSI
jgi:hypothetical protein